MKRIASILLLLSVALSLSAQWKMKPNFSRPRTSNVSFEVQGGGGALLINNSTGSPTRNGFTAGANIGYTYMFNKTTGVHTGLGFNYLNSGYNSPNILSKYIDDIDTWDNTRDYHGYGDITSNTGSVEEKYNTFMVSIPLQLSYVYEAFWLQAGFRFTLPISIAANYAYGTTMVGLTYVYQTGTDLSGNPIYFDDLTVPAQSGSYSAYSISDGIRVMADVLVEGGYRIPTSNTSSVYMGVFVSYSLNNLNISTDDNFITYNEGHTPEFHGALNSTATSSLRGLTFGAKVFYNMAFGRVLR